jgi:hypothetical protein
MKSTNLKLVVLAFIFLTGCVMDKKGIIYYYINNLTKHNLLIEFQSKYGNNPQINTDSINSFQNKYFFVYSFNGKAYDIEGSTNDPNLHPLLLLNIYKDKTIKINKDFLKKDLWHYLEIGSDEIKYELTLDSTMIK